MDKYYSIQCKDECCQSNNSKSVDFVMANQRQSIIISYKSTLSQT